ncbi:thiol:disulfide interchange protein DsbG [Marinobacter orientalis]|uniref:Thiol:disulfide interchange protein n=1 Tax=Marinobacter orientalis TaxID=1928859 RepID=A0A7Y0WS80_9GAMM|nr:thiol:disulfide interchange protein DsbG [Marinobacter orientalis]NMT63595.1 thiol:disulfide interchange protein DsbG [Marinobacter orientalis]TGX49714.1 thiol:disulfide interchange protein DsbG [Marinobacter orientalis]
MLRSIIKVFSALLLLPSMAFAAYPDAVQVLVDEGLEVEASFEAPGGVKGFVGRRNGHPVSLYLMPDGEHVVIGRMADGFGQDLSADHIRKWLPGPDLSGAWQKLADAAWVSEGPSDAERIVYAFTDPNCGYCVTFREKAQRYLERGIELRHIMVGIIQPSSLAKAASVLGADDPVSKLDFHDSQFPRDWLESEENVPQELRKLVQSNNQLMESLAVAVTPSVFYKDPDGDLRKIVGLPDDSALSEAVFRHPE